MRALLKLKSAEASVFTALLLVLSSCGGAGDCGTLADGLTEIGASAEAVAAAEATCKAELLAVSANCAADDEDCVSIDEVIAAAKANPHSKHPVELALAFKQIRLENPEKAQATLSNEDYDLLTAENEPEVYTYIIASLKISIDSLGSLIETAQGFAAPGLLPMQTDFRSFVDGVLSDVTSGLEDIAKVVSLIRNSEGEAYVNIPAVPLGFDPSLIDDSLPADLSVDLGGGWDRVELLAIGSLANGLLGVVDLIFAHSLKVTLTDLTGLVDEISTANIAFLFVNNPDLLGLDTPEKMDSAETYFKVALDLLVGEADGAPGSRGLLLEIEAEMAESDQAGDIIVFNDVNEDGQVSPDDTLDLKFVSQLIGEIEDLEEGDEIVSVPFERTVWVALVDLGRALNANLNGGAEFSLAKYLSAAVDGQADGTKYLWEELQEEVADNADGTALEGEFDFPGELPDLQDWIYLDPKAYFAAPLPIRNLLPAVTKFTQDGDSIYELALECELGYTAEQFANPEASGGLSEDSAIRALCANTTLGLAMVGKTIYFANNLSEAVTASTGYIAEGGAAEFDYQHFLGFPVTDITLDDEANFDITGDTVYGFDDLVNFEFKAIDFEEGLEPPADDIQIAPDGYLPAAHTAAVDPHDDILLSVLLQNPSLGGVLWLDLDPAIGSGPDEASNGTLNAGISYIWITFGGHIEALVDGLTDE